LTRLGRTYYTTRDKQSDPNEFQKEATALAEMRSDGDVFSKKMACSAQVRVVDGSVDHTHRTKFCR
jgi:hypothetical protein